MGERGLSDVRLSEFCAWLSVRTAAGVMNTWIWRSRQLGYASPCDVSMEVFLLLVPASTFVLTKNVGVATVTEVNDALWRCFSTRLRGDHHPDGGFAPSERLQARKGRTAVRAGAVGNPRSPGE